MYVISRMSLLLSLASLSLVLYAAEKDSFVVYSFQWQNLRQNEATDDPATQDLTKADSIERLDRVVGHLENQREEAWQEKMRTFPAGLGDGGGKSTLQNEIINKGLSLFVPKFVQIGNADFANGAEWIKAITVKALRRIAMIRSNKLHILFDRNGKFITSKFRPYSTLASSFYASDIEFALRSESNGKDVEVLVVDDAPLVEALRVEIAKHPNLTTIRVLEIDSNNACESYLTHPHQLGLPIRQ